MLTRRAMLAGLAALAPAAALARVDPDDGYVVEVATFACGGVVGPPRVEGQHVVVSAELVGGRFESADGTTRQIALGPVEAVWDPASVEWIDIEHQVLILARHGEFVGAIAALDADRLLRREPGWTERQPERDRVEAVRLALRMQEAACP